MNLKKVDSLEFMISLSCNSRIVNLKSPYHKGVETPNRTLHVYSDFRCSSSVGNQNVCLIDEVQYCRESQELCTLNPGSRSNTHPCIPTAWMQLIGNRRFRRINCWCSLTHETNAPVSFLRFTSRTTCIKSTRLKSYFTGN